MRLSNCFFAGVPTDQDWSQSFVYVNDDVLFGLVVHIGSPQEDVAIKGKQILKECSERASSLNRSDFLTYFKTWNEAGVDLAAVFIQGNRVVLFAQGRVGVLLNRAGVSQTILVGKEVGVFVEGECKPGDYYTLGTNGYLAKFEPVDQFKLPQEACDRAVMKLHQLPQSGDISAVFVKSQIETVPEPEMIADEKVEPVLKTLPSQKQFKSNPNFWKLFKIAGLVGVVALILLGSSLYLTRQKAADLAKNLAPYQSRYEQLLSLPQEKHFDELQGLRELQRDLSERILQTKELSLKRALEGLEARVQQSFTDGSGEKRITKLNVFYDFRLIAPDFVSSSVAFDDPGKSAVFLDGAHSRLLSLSLEKKEALTLSVDEKLPSPFALAVANRKAYVLGNGGVMELPLPLDKMGSIVANRNAMWVEPKLIDAFGTSAYIFDKGARNILKIDLTDLSASPTGWLRSKEGIEFENIVSMRIDGGVWLGDNSGKILHFMQGSPAAFVYTNVLDKPASAVYLYTTQESKNLYVLEPHAKRILILTKDGTYQHSIISDDLLTATGIIVDESSNNAYILSGSLVYQVGL